jgi:hypothetical protein
VVFFVVLALGQHLQLDAPLVLPLPSPLDLPVLLPSPFPSPLSSSSPSLPLGPGRLLLRQSRPLLPVVGLLG